MMNWTTRPMTPGDWAMVSFIYSEGISSRIATFTTAMPTLEEWFGTHMNVGRLILENEQGQICGFTCLTQPRGCCSYGGFAELSIYVADEWQGKGAGKFLLNALIEESEKQGIWTLASWIFKKNEPSIKLHKACGFREVGYHEKIGKLDGEWIDIVVMERRSPKV